MRSGSELFTRRFGILGALHADSFPRPFASAGVCARALSTNREAAPMADTAVAVDRLQALEVGLQLAAQIALDRQFARGDRLDDLVELLVRQILRTRLRIDIGLLEDLLRRARANAVDVRQRRFDAFVAGDFNA